MVEASEAPTSSFQTRAHAQSLHMATKALRPQGTVVDLAFYQGRS